MFRQSKKIVGVLCALALVFVGVCSSSFTSKAAVVVQVPWNQPEVTNSSGYLTIVYRTSSGEICADTHNWCFAPVSVSEQYGANGSEFGIITLTINDYGMDVTADVMPGTIAYFTYWTYGYYGSAGTRANVHLNAVTGNSSHTQNFNFGTNKIIGFEVGGGNVRVLNNASTSSTYDIVYGGDSALYDQMSAMIIALSNLNASLSGKLDSIINNIITLTAEVDSVEEALELIRQELNSLYVEQKETNSWLEKIFDEIAGQPDEERETATNQGNSSVSEGNSAIEDKGGDFAGALGGLVSAVSTTDTTCSWSFPLIRLPAIPGVMDEVILFRGTTIDFNYWVNQIPSSIMTVIRSLLTIGLIIYCFKELYSTIAYVLTLRKDDNS